MDPFHSCAWHLTAALKLLAHDHGVLGEILQGAAPLDMDVRMPFKGSILVPVLSRVVGTIVIGDVRVQVRFSPVRLCENRKQTS